LSYRLRLQTRRPDGGEYVCEQRFDKIVLDNHKSREELLGYHAKAMRERAMSDIERQRWTAPKEDLANSHRKSLTARFDREMEQTFKGGRINIDRFWRVNEEVSFHSASIGEPLDDLRIQVAKWLT
jgi:hypothetical protein